MQLHRDIAVYEHNGIAHLITSKYFWCSNCTHLMSVTSIVNNRDSHDLQTNKSHPIRQSREIGFQPTDVPHALRLRPYRGCIPSLDALLAFATASLALLVIPGPAVLYIINRSVSDGRSVALSAVAGLEIGNFFHVVAATAGLSAIIAASQTAFTAVKWIGAGYLVFIGLRTLLRKPAVFCDTSTSVTLRRSFAQGPEAAASRPGLPAVRSVGGVADDAVRRPRRAPTAPLLRGLR